MGFASGFQVGAQAVERGLKMREEDRLREQLAKAYAQPESFTDYTPEQIKEIQRLQATGAYDVNALPGAEGQVPTLRYTPRQGLELGQGDMPAPPTDFTPQQVQRYGGQTVAGQFDPTKLQGLQMREAARVVGASGDPVRASQLLAEANRLDREAIEAPLRQKGLEQQLALGGEQLTTAQRTNQLAIGNQNAQNALAEMRAGNKPITSQTLAKIAADNKADYNTLLASELNQIGFTEKTAAVEMKNLSRDWSKAVLGGAPTINKFLADKFDPDKSDNITPELVQTKAGFVVMYGGKQLNEYGVHKDLNTLAAQVNGIINDDPLGTLKTLAQVKASNAAAATSEAELGLIPEKKKMYGAQANYYNTRGNMEKMGATQYFTGSDGNMYASTPVFKGGKLEFESTLVNPKDVKFVKPGTEGKEKDMKPGKVAEEGEKATVGGKLHIADGLGNWVPTDGSGKPLGVLPSDRAKFLEKANIPTNMIPQIPWNTNGTEVLFGGKAYEVNNPADIKELKADYKRLGANTIAVEEEQRNIPGRNTGLLSVGQPYDPYGASQRPRMGATQAEIDAFNAQKALQARNRTIAQRQTDLYNVQQFGLE
jgi:hypothetical protein